MSPARHRLFVALWPPEALLAQLRALPRPSVPGLRWTSEEQWHVTLRFLGPVVDPAEVDGALRLLPRVTPVIGRAGPAVEPKGRSLLWVPVDGLDELAAATVSVTAEIGLPPEPRPFRGHLTLARSKGNRSLAKLAGSRVEATWPVPEITLVESETHPDGARYTVIGRYAV